MSGVRIKAAMWQSVSSANNAGPITCAKPPSTIATCGAEMNGSGLGLSITGAK